MENIKNNKLSLSSNLNSEHSFSIRSQENHPTEILTAEMPMFIKVSPDKLSAKYGSKLHFGYGSFRSNNPLPKNTYIYYFEVEIIGSTHVSDIVIGLADSNFKQNERVGNCEHSYGYSSKSYKQKLGLDIIIYGENYHKGDVVGCGINFTLNEVFFIRNGNFLGTAFYNVKGNLYPVVTLYYPGDEIKFNFGSKDYIFGINNYIKSERLKFINNLNKIELDDQLNYILITGYLLHNAYYETYLKFIPYCNYEIKDEKLKKYFESLLDSIEIRRKIKTLITDCKINAARNLLISSYKGISKNKPLMFFVESQNFIELIRTKKIKQAVKYSISVFKKYLNNDLLSDKIEILMSLFAFKDPCNSFLGNLFSKDQLFYLADFVNCSILEHLNIEKISPLTKIIKQMFVVDKVLRMENDGRGEKITLTTY